MLSSRSGKFLLVLLLAAPALAARPRPTPPRPPPPAPPKEVAAEAPTSVGYEAPALPTPRRQAVQAPPPPPPKETWGLPAWTIAPAIEFSLDFEPAILEDVPTTISRGGFIGAVHLKVGRLSADLGAGSLTIKETGTPATVFAGFGVSGGATVDIINLSEFWLRAGTRAHYAQSEGYLLAQEFKILYRWFDVELDLGAAWKRGGLEVSLLAAGRWLTGALEAPDPIGTLAIRTGGPRSQVKLGGSSLGFGLRATAAWYFQLAPEAKWGGMLAAGFDAISPWGGRVTVGVWF